MEQSRVVSLPPPPGVIGSLRAGFDLITAHLTAIILPVCFDLFLWLGPRLSLQRLFSTLKPDMLTLWQAGGVSNADVQTVMSLYESAVPTFNLFWILRTLPIGISSLMFARDVPQTPLGTVASWQVSAQAMPLWIMGLVVLGWIGGGLYFRGVARACRQQSDPASPHVAWAVGQSVLLSLLWLALAVALALPTFVVVSLLLQVNTTVAQVAILAVSFFSMWLIVPLFFWPHGVFLRRQNVLLSMLSSIRMTRFTLPTSSFFVLSAFLLGVGLNLIWGAAPSDSWMTLVGILGHGFITTALLAASFIYYRDMSAWLDTALERLRAKGAVPKQI